MGVYRAYSGIARSVKHTVSLLFLQIATLDGVQNFAMITRFFTFQILLFMSEGVDIYQFFSCAPCSWGLLGPKVTN